jgi:hypothetical protein
MKRRSYIHRRHAARLAAANSGKSDQSADAARLSIKSAHVAIRLPSGYVAGLLAMMEAAVRLPASYRSVILAFVVMIVLAVTGVTGVTAFLQNLPLYAR